MANSDHGGAGDVVGLGQVAGPAALSSRAGTYRWRICALLFAVTAINYIDRQMLGVLKPMLKADLHWTEIEFADIVFWFQAAYTIGFLGFGRLVDRIGPRYGYTLAFSFWTIAHVAHAAVRTIGQFAIARFALGAGESGNFPVAIRAVAEWFPVRERALAIGIFNAGANIGAIVTPLLVPWLVSLFHGDWRPSFVITGLGGLVWLAFWLKIYRDPSIHPGVNEGERAWIRQDDSGPVTPVPLRVLFGRRETWAFAIGKFCIDPIWWFYLFWLPGYLAERYHLNLLAFGPPLVVVYLLSDAGSVVGGWFSGRLMRAGSGLNMARKGTMLLSALCVAPIFLVQGVDNLWLAVLIIGCATAGHQAFSANLYAVPSDTFPRQAIGSVIGIGGAAGGLGGMLFSLYVGRILERLGTYAPIFATAALAYFVAILFIQLLSPRLARATIS